MERYEKEIIEAIQVFYLIQQDIRLSLPLLDNKSVKGVHRLAFRTLVIDLMSMLDEIKHFKKCIYKSKTIDPIAANKFLLLSYHSIKLLHKYQNGVRKMRNNVYTHNYRGDKSEFKDPLKIIMQHYQELPVLEEEVRLLGRVALRITDLAQQCFYYNDMSAYSELQQTSMQFENSFPTIASKSIHDPEEYYTALEKDINEIRFSLSSHPENYLIVANKIGCPIKPMPSDL